MLQEIQVRGGFKKTTPSVGGVRIFSGITQCLKKNYQPFSLAGVLLGSLVNQISGLKSAWCRSGLCLTVAM